jgi:hypothetical protein
MTKLVARMQQENPTDVKGTECAVLLLSLYELGFSVRQYKLTDKYPIDRPPTLQRFLRERDPMQRVAPALIHLYGSKDDHISACHMDYFCDNWTRKPVHMSKMPMPRRKVLNAWSVIQ